MDRRPRRRYVTRGEAPVWCPGGRWGPRRVRVTECHTVMRAEAAYTWLLRENPAATRPGASGAATFTVADRFHTFEWELRSNAVWRAGRMFLRCPQCRSRCTRLYLPIETAWLACRTCWGLSYNSRVLLNYRDSLWGRGAFARAFGTTQRDWAFMTTDDHRQSRTEGSRQRWEDRGPLLARRARSLESDAHRVPDRKQVHRSGRR